jgi:delta-aminolevulinic acid dehydratase/porphobilinogen synthase
LIVPLLPAAAVSKPVADRAARWQRLGLGGVRVLLSAADTHAAGALSVAEMVTVIARVREAAPRLEVTAEVCACLGLGQCVVTERSGRIDAARTASVLLPVAVALAAAGAGVIALAGALDGMAAGVRAALDGAGAAGTRVHCDLALSQWPRRAARPDGRRSAAARHDH